MSVDSGSDIDMLYMPDELKRDFCMELLESCGADRISLQEGRGEILHCCVMPWHSDSRPSASLNFLKMVYKCLSCGASGGILWLIGTVHGKYGPEARSWLAEQTGFGGSDFVLAPLLKFLDAVDEAKVKRNEPAVMPYFSEVVLEPWNFIYPGLTTGDEELGIKGRGIPEKNLVEARVGWDMEDNRIIIPHFWEGRLVGWQGRAILPDPDKYKSTSEFPRDRTIYRRPQGKKVVVVESPMSVLQHMHHLPITSTFGAEITAQQIAILKWYPEVVLFMDNDPAGWKVIEGRWDSKGSYYPGAAEILTAYCNVKVVDYDWAADPQELDDSTVSDLVDQAVPLSLWNRPTGALRCLLCKQCHGGPCVD